MHILDKADIQIFIVNSFIFNKIFENPIFFNPIAHTEWPKLYGILDVLSEKQNVHKFVVPVLLKPIFFHLFYTSKYLLTPIY